ncbi:MAG: hypothetical protein ABW175_21390 [Bradyrhizobium sp.]
MRKFILIAGFVLASATAHAGDRSLSMGTESAPPVAKTVDVPRTAEAPAAETPRYTERPAVAAPKPEAPAAETPNAETPRADTSRTERPRMSKRGQYAGRQMQGAPSRQSFRKGQPSFQMAKPRRNRWLEAKIIRELHRHGVYW